MLVTGATSGIGLEAARSLAQQGANVVLVGRDAAKTTRCLEEVRKGTPSAEVTSLLGDFSRQADVRRLAYDVLHRFDRLTAELNLDRERARGWTIAQTVAWTHNNTFHPRQVETARWLLEAA